MDEKKNAWKTALLDRLRRAEVEFEDDITPDSAIELFASQLIHKLREKLRISDDDKLPGDNFPTGVLILSDMDGLKIEGASSELAGDDNVGARHPVLILSRRPYDSAHSLYIVLKDPRALRSFHLGLADAATAIMHPELARDVSDDDDTPSEEQFNSAAERFLEMLNRLKQQAPPNKD
jgi:hypothetical protein